MPVLSEQERLIEESVTSFFDRAGGVARTRALRDAAMPIDRPLWQDAARQGWLGILVPEVLGGLDLSPRDAVAMVRALGRSAPFEPFAAAIASARCLCACAPGHPALQAILSGDELILPVFAKDVAGAPGALAGSTRPAPDLAIADRFLLVCSSDAGTRLFLIGRNNFGLSFHASATRDGGSLATLGLHKLDAELIADNGEADRAARDLADLLRLCRAAELVGIASQAFSETLDYLQTRRQFGVPLASFQALQHRAASLYVELSADEALLFEAAGAWGGPRQSFGATAALVRASSTAMKVCKEAVQMHGAIGFTDELSIGLYLKRAMALCAVEGGERAILSTHSINERAVRGNMRSRRPHAAAAN